MASLQRASVARTKRVEPQVAIRSAAEARRNFNIGVVNGVLGGVLDPLSGLFMLTLFLTHLGAPPSLVGLLTAISSCGGLLPQLLVAGKLRGQKRVMHWYRWATFGRVGGLGTMALSVWLAASNTNLTLAGLFAGFTLYSFSSGVSGIPFMEVVGKIVPPHRKGTFFGLRQFGSAIVSMATSALAGAAMAEHLGLRFPYNFAAMLSGATIGGVLVFGIWSCVREPELANAVPPDTGSILRHGIKAVRTDRDYRLFMTMRLLSIMAGLPAPFYAIFATKELHIPMETMAIYMMAQAAIPVVAGLAWAPLANRAPRRKLMLIAMGLQFWAAALAASVICFGRLLPGGWQSYLMGAVFIGSAITGSAGIFNDNVLLGIAPDGERPTYFGFLNTLCGVASLVIPLGGVLIVISGYAPLLILSTAFAILALLAGLGMGQKANARQALPLRAIASRLPRRAS